MKTRKWYLYNALFYIGASLFFILLAMLLSTSCTDAPMAPERAKQSNVVILEVNKYNGFSRDTAMVSITLWNNGHAPAWHVGIFYKDPEHIYLQTYPGTIQVDQLHEFVFMVPIIPGWHDIDDFDIFVEWEDYGY